LLDLIEMDVGFREALVQEALAICRIPSPTFGERNRAQYIAGRLGEFGLKQVEIDDLSNVTALLPADDRRGRPIMLVAHIDTVFPEGTNVEPRWDGRYWRAPGIRDNSASVAITLLLPELLRRNGVRLARDLILAFSVGEEGLGNLRGMRALMDRYGDRVSAVIAVDGNLGVVNHVAISVRRLEIAIKAAGGHSWADAGKPSAVHVLARVAGKISEIAVPSNPKTVLNIGTVSGGTSVNAIAQQASLSLDIRSLDHAVVQALEAEVRGIVDAIPVDEQIDVAVSVIGDRPGGEIASSHPLIRAVLEGFAAVGITGSLLPGSTDANIPLSLGIAAASMGVTSGGSIHTLQEFLDPESLPIGASALLRALILMQEDAKL
jgi:acetylornithine deacetylase/succinyl-diaminopimelate desuccinylase-like protein